MLGGCYEAEFGFQSLQDLAAWPPSMRSIVGEIEPKRRAKDAMGILRRDLDAVDAIARDEEFARLNELVLLHVDRADADVPGGDDAREG